LTGKRAVVDAFLAASRNGDFNALLAVLSADVTLRPDQAALAATATTRLKGAPKLAELHGAEAVADAFCGRAQAARRALIDGSPGAVWAPGGVPRVVFSFAIADDKIVELEVLADPERIRELELVMYG
jgi:RNA polymerase sigma-70 factor (ECF subfamily)